MTLFAIVPVKDLAYTKSRLQPVLDGADRASLTLHMMNNVLTALREAGVERICVISPDPKVLQTAGEAGVMPLPQQSRGLNEALEEARGWAVERGATSLLVLPADLPLLRSADVEAVLEVLAEEAEGSLAAISPDAAGTGTNALLLRSPHALPFLFGPGSFEAHLNAARERGTLARIRERDGLAFDLDTVEDLGRFGDAIPGARAETSAQHSESSSEELRVLPVTGLPEVRPGDNLASLIAGTMRNGLQDGDIVVVTHKVVSKAEGRLIDLGTIQPSAFAKGFASRHDKDPRQVEVVLRESKRIVRMDRGIIISETHHGFVCANAGVDASNVPGDDTVCLLPLDPDASAHRLRDALVAKSGKDLAVVVSDSFGRAWRQGITNIAIGVAGMQPLADYRGEIDPYGNLLTASILAVADELAATAELVMGKTISVPIAIIRNYPYEKGSGTAHDLLMPPERDLFR